MRPDAFATVLALKSNRWAWCVMNMAGKIVKRCKSMWEAVKETLRLIRLEAIRDYHLHQIATRAETEAKTNSKPRRNATRNQNKVTQTRERHAHNSWWKG